MAAKLPQQDGIVISIDLPELVSILRPAAPYWEQFGHALNLSIETIEIIEKKGDGKTPKDKMIEVLIRLRRQKLLNWDQIIKSTEILKNCALAQKLRQLEKVEYSDSEYVDNMLNHLTEVIPYWEQFGLQMGLKPNELEEIDNAKTVENCFFKLLCAWIREKGKEATVQCLKKACEAIKDLSLRDKLMKDEYVQKTILQRQPEK